jgi:hypothetical protein
MLSIGVSGKSMRSIYLPVVAVFSFAFHLCALTVPFQPAVTYDSGTPCSNAIAVADVNADGKLDVILASGCYDFGDRSTLGTVGVLLGNGDGSFQPSVSFYSGGISPSSIRVADVNGDGKPDLLILNECSDIACATGAIGVFLGNGDGTFQSPITIDEGDDSNALAVADVNHDGKLDIVVSQIDSVAVLLGNGDGTFQPFVAYSANGVGVNSVAIADVNQDGNQDIVASIPCSDDSCTSALAAVFLGNGDGTFRAVVDYVSGGVNSSAIEVADLNGDGHPDILSASICGADDNCSSGAVSVLLGYGDGTFAPAVTYSTGAPDTFGMAVGDMNGDGVLDVVVADCSFPLPHGSACPGGSGVVSVLLGNGDATFQPPATHPSGGIWANSIAIADVNGDGQADILTANRQGENNGDGTLGVLRHDNKNFHAATVSITSSSNPSFYTQAVTFSAVVSSPQGTIPNGDVVTFFDGATAIGTGTTSSGVATFTTALLFVKTHAISVVYSGDSIFRSSDSGTLLQVVSLYPTATTLVSNPNPSNRGQSVTFTITVTSGGPVPTGKVRISDGSVALKSVTLNNGVATYTTSKLPLGTDPMTAKYTGDSSHAKSVSQVLNQVVQ